MYLDSVIIYIINYYVRIYVYVFGFSTLLYMLLIVTYLCVFDVCPSFYCYFNYYYFILSHFAFLFMSHNSMEMY